MIFTVLAVIVIVFVVAACIYDFPMVIAMLFVLLKKLI